MRRRRECLACKHRFTTYERMEAPRLLVVKRNGRREQFNREKVLSGLRRAAEKTSISDSAVEEVAAALERDLFSRGENEVPAELIGEKLMESLKELDKVAYVRFASVYRKFQDLESFQAELANLLAK